MHRHCLLPVLSLFLKCGGCAAASGNTQDTNSKAPPPALEDLALEDRPCPNVPGPAATGSMDAGVDPVMPRPGTSADSKSKAQAPTPDIIELLTNLGKAIPHLFIGDAQTSVTSNLLSTSGAPEIGAEFLSVLENHEHIGDKIRSRVEQWIRMIRDYNVQFLIGRFEQMFVVQLEGLVGMLTEDACCPDVLHSPSIFKRPAVQTASLTEVGRILSNFKFHRLCLADTIKVFRENLDAFEEEFYSIIPGGIAEYISEMEACINYCLSGHYKNSRALTRSIKLAAKKKLVSKAYAGRYEDKVREVTEKASNYATALDGKLKLYIKLIEKGKKEMELGREALHDGSQILADILGLYSLYESKLEELIEERRPEEPTFEELGAGSAWSSLSEQFNSKLEDLQKCFVPFRDFLGTLQEDPQGVISEYLAQLEASNKSLD